MQAQLRRTKIIATLGPATDAPGMLERILEEGVDVVRLNLSHGAADDHRRRAEQARSATCRGRRSASPSSPPRRFCSKPAGRSRSNATPARRRATSRASA